MDQQRYGDYPAPPLPLPCGEIAHQHRRYPSPAFVGRKRQFSHSAHEYTDGVKLYVQGLPKDVTKEDIGFLFGKHGNIIEVVPLKERRNLQQEECCFVKYAKIEDADQAIRALHNQYTFPGGMYPIKVKYASGEQERLGLRTHESKVFVSGLNKQASKVEIAEIFSVYGSVQEVFLLRDEQRQNVGKGFISFSHRYMAAAAINGLNDKYVMRGCDQPLFVRYADPKKPKTGDSRPVVPDIYDLPNKTDCDWSEHICPDGYTYYYNSATCESRWEKPEEFGFYEQQGEKCF